MAIKVGINGFGRIGRMAFRAIAKDFPGIEVVGINDLLDPDYLAYMLKYDSVHGNFPGDISVDGNTMIVNGKKIRLTAERDPANLKWNEVGADLVCTAAHRWALARGLQHGVWDWLAAHRTHCTQITDPSRLTPHHAACHVIQ